MIRMLHWPLSTLLLLLVFCNGYAQNKKYKQYIDLTAGPAFPLGKYASTKIDDDAAGFAKPGEFFNASYTLLFKKRSGLTIALHANRNGIDTKAMENGFSNTGMIAPSFTLTSSIGTSPTTTSHPTYPNWKFDKSSWLSGSLMAGWHQEFQPANEKITFFAKAMLGAVYAKSPKLNGSSVTDTVTANVEVSSKKAFGVAYSFCAGMRYSMNKKISLLTNVQYLGTSNIKFENVSSTVTVMKRSLTNSFMNSAIQSTIIGTARQKISLLNIQVGIGINI